MKILLTGSNGFVGRSVMKAFINEGHEVVPIVRNKSKENEIAVGEINGDTIWPACFDGVEVIVHCASRINSIYGKNIKSLWDFRAVNVEGSTRLIEEAVKNNVKRFVYISSAKVHGETNHKNGVFRETDAANPEDYYSLSKYEAEIELMSFAKKNLIEVVIIRPPLVYGIGVKGNFRLMINFLKYKVPLPLDNVCNLRSIIALQNLVDFIVLCSSPRLSRNATNQIFFISDGVDFSTSDLLKKISFHYRYSGILIKAPKKIMKILLTCLKKKSLYFRLYGSLRVSISKAESLLEWKPIVSIDNVLKEMAEYDQDF